MRTEYLVKSIAAPLKLFSVSYSMWSVYMCDCVHVNLYLSIIGTDDRVCTQQDDFTQPQTIMLPVSYSHFNFE